MIRPMETSGKNFETLSLSLSHTLGLVVPYLTNLPYADFNCR